MLKARDILIEARKKIEDPKHWTKGAFFRDDEGNTVPSYEMELATCFCSLGAVQAVIPYSNTWEGEAKLATDALDKAVYSIDKYARNIVAYQDKHTHAEVLHAFDLAIRNLP